MGHFQNNDLLDAVLAGGDGHHVALGQVIQRDDSQGAVGHSLVPLQALRTPELLARVRAMLRRKENYLPDLLTVGGLALNRSTYELSWQGKSQSLSGREFQILEMLMERPGFVVTTNQLLSHVWGWDSDVDCSVVWVHISNIRKKLARLGAPAGIRFLRGAGYVLEVAQ